MSFWSRQLDRLGEFFETEPVQYDLYLGDEHIVGISAIGAAADAWIVGGTFSYPYQGQKREFVVEKLTPEGGRARAILFFEREDQGPAGD